MIKGAYPHITIRHVSPVETRAYFNTRVLDKNLTQDEKYAIRKNLSKQTMHKFYAPADAERALELLGAKSDDAIEAGLLAIYCHNVPCTDEAKRKRLKKTRNSDKPLVSFCARTRFASGAQVRLTDAERKQVYGDTKEELKERKAAKKERAERKARGEKKKKKAKPKKPKKEKAAPGRRKGVRPAPPSP